MATPHTLSASVTSSPPLPFYCQPLLCWYEQHIAALIKLMTVLMMTMVAMLLFFVNVTVCLFLVVVYRQWTG